MSQSGAAVMVTTWPGLRGCWSPDGSAHPFLRLVVGQLRRPPGCSGPASVRSWSASSSRGRESGPRSRRCWASGSSGIWTTSMLPGLNTGGFGAGGSGAGACGFGLSPSGGMKTSTTTGGATTGGAAGAAATSSFVFDSAATGFGATAFSTGFGAGACAAAGICVTWVVLGVVDSPGSCCVDTPNPGTTTVGGATSR